MNARELVQTVDQVLRSTPVPPALGGWGADALEVGRNLRQATERALEHRARPVAVDQTELVLEAEPGAARFLVRGAASPSVSFEELASSWGELSAALRATGSELAPLERAFAEVRIA